MVGQPLARGDAREAFLEGLVDYAGLFPPARLPMEEAVALYSEHRSGPHNWMLGRFICPSSRLAELAELVPEEADEQPWKISVVMDGAGEQWPWGIARDLESARRFAEQCSGLVELFEARLPAALVEGADPAAMADGVHSFMEEVSRSGLGNPVVPFFEIPLGKEWRQTLPAALEGLARVRESFPLEPGICLAPGAKIRCGGETAEAHPYQEQVAAFISVCSSFEIPFKATAGLHHPFRRIEPETGIVQHGFVNVVGATILAFASGLPESELTNIVAEDRSPSFSLTSEEFQWRGRSAGVREISQARAGLFTAYGSCSFAEPVEDLVESGILPMVA